MDLLIALYLVIFFLVPAASDMAIQMSDAEKLQRLENLLFEHILEEYPEFSTETGNMKFSDTLESYNLEAFDRRKILNDKFLQELKAINTSNLTKLQQLDLMILEEHIQTFVDGYKWREYGSLNPLNFLEGPIKHRKWLNTRDDFANFHRHAERIRQLPEQIDQQISLMKRSMELNRTNHMYSMEHATKLLVMQRYQFFMKPFYDLDDSFWENMPSHWYTLIDYLEKLLPAIEKLRQFILYEYMKSTRCDEGVSSFQDGFAYYQACLKFHLGLNMTIRQVHDTGLSEVNRIADEMNTIMKRLEFNGTLQEFFAHLKTIPDLYNKTKEEILEGYQDIIDSRIETKLWDAMKNKSISPVRVVTISREHLGFQGAYSNGTFLVNIYKPETRSTFTMMPLALHETNPGHHFQELYYDKNSLPDYRRWTLYGRRYATPFNYPTYTAYIEGWALYSEYLGEELGLYRDAYELFGRYCSEILRACRLVVDTGIHSYGWTKEMAVNYIANYTDLTHSEISAEVDKYITWPGHSCAYKIGELKFKELRHKAQNMLGNAFDIKEFHDTVLKYGPMSLRVLEHVVDEWLNDKLSNISQFSETFEESSASLTHIPTNMQYMFISFLQTITFCIIQRTFPV